MEEPQACITCKHLVIDQIKLAKLKLTNNTKSIIKSKCKKDHFLHNGHSIEFLETRHGDMTNLVNLSVRKCKNYKAIK